MDISNLLAARLQMAVSLGFHIIFAAIGVAMPFFMAVSHYFYIKTGKKVYLDLTKAWSKGVAIFFATGAVSGTVLSFELGLLWPGFMKHAGPIIGMPFSWEGTAFFLEAIALGLFLYGWDKLKPWVHWTCGLVVGISGVASAMFVICANSWMNSPSGFDWVNGEAINIDPVAAMFNDAALMQGLHMVIASFQATGVAVAGLHAFLLIKDRKNIFHKQALKIALCFAAAFSLVQPIAGDLLAKDTVKRQPVKFAAMESLFETQKGAPLLLGGIPDVENRTVNYGIHIPYLLSFLAHADFNAEVKGLNDFDRDLWPPVPVTHYAFQIMVGIGTLLALSMPLMLLLAFRYPEKLTQNLSLYFLSFCVPLGFIAIESGWVVTEVGRQPWIIHGIMKTKDAVTPVPGMVYSFIAISILYIILALLVAILMRSQIKALPEEYSRKP